MKGLLFATNIKSTADDFENIKGSLQKTPINEREIFEKVENIVAKGNIAYYYQFLLLPHYFQTLKNCAYIRQLGKFINEYLAAST